MADTYVATLDLTSLSIEGVTLTVARTVGTSCDEMELIYKNIYQFHPLRHWNLLYLYTHLSTIPAGIEPVNCFCIGPLVEVVA